MQIKKGEYEEIPKDWNISSLHDLCIIRNSKKVNSNFYVGLEHMGQGTGHLISYSHEKKYLTKKVFLKNDVLYGKLRPLLHKIWLADRDGYCSTDILPLVPNEKINSKFLFYTILSNRFLKFSLTTVEGANLPRTRWKDLGDFMIPLPEINEQKKISLVISQIDNLLQNSKKILEQTTDLKKELIESFTTMGIDHIGFKKIKPYELHKNWNTLTISQIAKKDKNSIKRGPWGSSLKKEFFVKKGYKIYEQQNAIYDDFERGDYYISEEKFNELSDFEIKPNDFIISCSGTIGKISIVPNGIERGIINQALLKLSLEPSLIDLRYFLYLFQTRVIQKMFVYSSHGSTMKNVVSLEELKKITLNLPPLSEQQKISSIIQKIDAQIQTQYEYNSYLEKFREGLIQKLLMGKIRVTSLSKI